MSKEIAQTVGGKRIAWLIAIVAAFAVFATVSLQSNEARADAVITCGTVNADPPSGAIGNIPLGAAIYCQAVTVDPVTGGIDWGTTGTATVTVTGDGVATTVGQTPSTNASFTATTAGTFQVTVAFTDGNGPHPASQTGQTTAATFTVVGVTGSANTVAAGQAATVTFNIPAGITYCSDATASGANPRVFAAGDQVVVGLTVGTTTPSVANNNADGTHTVTVLDDATAGGTVTLSTHLAGAAAGVGCTSTVVTLTAANFAVPELRHMSDTANIVVTKQEVNNNVRGSRHTVCMVAQNTGLDFNGDGDYTDALEVAPVAVLLPGITLANIVVTNGGGYASTIDTDPDFTDVRIFTGDGTATSSGGYGLTTYPTATAGLLNATCISWVSTDAGDQQINVVYVGLNGVQYNASWDTDRDENDNDGFINDNDLPNTSLIKEWNRLESSLLTIEGVSQGALQDVSKSYGVVLDPATGLYRYVSSDGDVDILDAFLGSHTNSAGVKEGPFSLAGVVWTVSESGCDAAVTSNGTWNLSAYTGITTLLPDGSVGNTPAVAVMPGDCLPGQSVLITIQGWEPGPLGSGSGVVVTETVRITWTQNIAEKQVFLAWAGQRIILEHDWRIAAGDGGSTGQSVGSDYPTPNGTCPFSGQGNFGVQYIKGTGPGNFVAGLSADISGADEAWVYVGTSDVSQSLESIGVADDDDINNDPQDNCISRVLYESEDPGEVDIEAFAYACVAGPGCGDENYTKVAFVVYYMKINTINVSLVTQVSKPSHNSSYYADYAPGNPWDASKDDADNATDWNVSKDLLVRGRVTGWFTNSNPSGRAADTSNPLNVLPANRWVMPQDWPLLAGGPGDPADGTDATGTAEQFRPYYDIFFAPNNTRGLALATPTGLGGIEVTVVITGSTGKGSYLNSTVNSPIRVASCSDLPAGRQIFFGASTTPYYVWACASGFLFVHTSSSPSATAAGLPAAPAVGTPIFYATGFVPFEGPFSLLDIVGLAAEGRGGAALSNYNPPFIRDTANDDGDVDMWDAPMPPAPVSVAIRGTGFIKEVYKADVYYNGVANTSSQVYPNPYYIENIPGSPFIPAVVAGGGYLWNSWANDGPGGDGQGVYWYWDAVYIGTNSEGIGESLGSTDVKELGLIRSYYGDLTIARDLVVFSDNHGEFMVTANGDFKTDLTACTTNVLAGGKHCKTGDKVGTGTITATVDYPDFRGKHFPVLSNAATVTWLWGGYKDVTVEAGETDQYKYIVFHAMDRDGFCADTTGLDAVLLHSVLAANFTNYLGMTDQSTAFTIANMTGSAPSNARHNNDPVENVDFLIDSGEGIIIGSSDPYATINDGKQFATDVWTFSTLENNPAVTGIKEFPLSSLAATGATDECQAWIKVSNSLLGILNVLAIANDDEGNIGFDKIIDLTNTTSYTLNFRWSLVTWAGADAISVSDAIKGTGTSGKNPGGNDISASVTAIYGWDAAAQQWLGYFPSGVNVPGANDLVSLKTGSAFWIAITGPSSVTWTIASNVN
ncbi:hypothetical protein [Candidatus Amarobacter glycogenicus]|uniref:hypothetical protein n=1 Tax=Candidatus Amarobacter glycogenicus TaxID=3140699 RepID=UPI0031372360|nr:hypothetical protein [Dehalococcoidia bacterium]